MTRDRGERNGGPNRERSQMPRGLSGPAADPRAPYVRVAAVGLVCRETDDGRRWLLVRRSRPIDVWDPPGGRMERGEDLTTTVVREVAEETGLAVQVGGPCYALLTVYEGERLLAVSMACRVLGDPDRIRPEPGGTGEWRWVSAEEWQRLAADGRSTWDAQDVKKATAAASALWQADSAPQEARTE